jgi:hypothetical protein
MPPKRKPVEPEVERRGRPAMKFNQELADQFGITPGADPPRELVKVASIPTPPDVEQPTAPGRREEIVEAQSEERIVLIIREEMDELGERLARFGILFNANQKQTVLDYTMSVLAGYGGGGAVARR